MIDSLASQFVKVCGVRTRNMLAACVEGGASAIGLNFAASSRRHLSPSDAGALVKWGRRQFPERAMPLLVGVFVDSSLFEMDSVRQSVGLDLVQLHGSESPELCERAAPAIKALRVGGEADLAALTAYNRATALLIDASVEGRLGGTGQRIPFDLVRAACATFPERVIVAGGLNAGNVGEVIDAVHPLGVDTASGAENALGEPCAASIGTFIENARRAFENVPSRKRSA